METIRWFDDLHLSDVGDVGGKGANLGELTQARFPVPHGFVVTSGAYLETRDGRKIFDGISSWWVTLHGHADPRIAAAIAEQAATLEQVIFAGFTHEPGARRLLPCCSPAPTGV